jgi:hypothetical protein
MNRLLCHSFGILFLLTAVGCADERASEAAPTIPRKLDVSVRASGTQLQITNNETVVWTDIVAEVNDEYRNTIDPIKPGQSATVQLIEFATPEGKRFNPFGYKLTKLHLQAEVDAHGTKATWSGAP